MGVDFLVPPLGFQKSNSGGQPWVQVPYLLSHLAYPVRFSCKRYYVNEFMVIQSTIPFLLIIYLVSKVEIVFMFQVLLWSLEIHNLYN